MTSPSKPRARKAPTATKPVTATPPPVAIATPSTRAARTSIRLPRDVRAALGADPGATIAALLALREAVGDRSADDLRANPFTDVRLDAAAAYRPFGTSTVAELRDLRFTQRGLVDEAVRVSLGRTAAQIALSGLLSEAALIVSNDVRRRVRADDAPAYGVEGVRDDELIAALARLKATGRPVTPSTLRGQSGIDFRACQHFLARRGAALGLHALPDGKTYAWAPSESSGAGEPAAPSVTAAKEA